MGCQSGSKELTNFTNLYLVVTRLCGNSCDSSLISFFNKKGYFLPTAQPAGHRMGRIVLVLLVLLLTLHTRRRSKNKCLF